MAATPKTFTDGSTDLDEANLGLLVRGGKLQVKVNYFELLFTASSNVVTVVAGTDSDGEVISADLAWNVGAVRIDVTLSGFSVPPVMTANISVNSSTNVEKLWCTADTSTNARLSFITNATPGVAVDPDGDVQVNVLIIGA